MSRCTLKRAIAFIDRNVDDLGTLLAGISRHVEPILLSDDEPAPRQMVRAVKRRADLDAIHVIAHGRPGEVSFGAGALSLDTTEEHAAELAEVGRMLRGGAIYLWTCETARGRRGAAFVEALARASGAPIAASTQRVGAAARGGQWQLDARPGPIHESAPLTALGVASYAGVMATKTWKNRGSSDGWSTASNWTTDEVPAAGDDVVIAGSTTPIDSGVIPSMASSFASALKIEGAANLATAVAITSANQTQEIGGTDTEAMTIVTSGGPALSLNSTIFTDTGSTTTIASGGQTKDNTLALTGTVSDANGVNLVQIYDGATLLGTANFTAESATNWGFVTAALPDGIHSFTAKVTDNAGNTTTTSAVTVTVDATPPSVKSVSSRVSGSVKASQVVQITLNMSEKVLVSGTPGLLLNDGGTATYASGSGTQALTFEYTVPSNQGTSDLQVIGDTLPSPTAIQDLLGNAADLSAAKADLHLKVGSTTTTPATSLTLTGTQQTELFGSSSVNVTFASGATGSLILDASSQFTGTISGLSAVAPFNAIDLADIAFGSNTTVVYLASSTNTGTLTVSDGTHTANIALSGQYEPTSFTIASDGHGGTAVVDPVKNVSGSWSGVFSWPLIGIQSLVLPDGKILTYGTDQGGHQGAYKIYDVWDPVTNTHNTLPNKTLVDEFCGAAQIIPTTNEVLIAGGDARPLGSINTGIANTNIFDYNTDSLTPNPSGPMAFARWYPTLITLGTGQLLILGGADLSGTGVGYPEIFTPGAGWRTLTGAYIAEMATGSGYYYPRTWLASDGRVITVAAGGTAVYAIDTSGNGQVSVIGQAPVSLNFGEPAIMFAQDRCLILGADGSVWVMDISGPTPVFTLTGSLAPDRIWSNLTVLPDGRVMVSGGSRVDNQLTGVEYTVAIWDPSTGLWTSTGANAAVPRLYHSTAILLPDATVLSLGGGGLDPDVPSMNHLNGEIYTPGYLFDASGAAAVRPVIQQAPLDLSPGQTFTVRVDNPANIRTLALMPFGSTTHSLNTTARRIELSFSVQADGSLSVTLPVNSDVVPPGDWMLFAIGNNGTPSIASTIHVNPYLSLSNALGTDTGSTATITSLGTTKDNTLALSGTLSVAKGFSSVQVYDGATLLGPATVSSGNWSYTTAALLDGSHSFTAKATDNAGNTTTTFAVTATVDTTPPTETISTTINTDTGATTTITSGGVTKDNTLGLSGTVSDAGGVSSVQIYDGATLLGPALLTGSYTAGYAFNESSGTTTADATGHGITGTLVNGATFTTAGKYGNAVALNGVNGYVDLGNPTALQLTGSMTVSAWIYATAFPGDDAAVVSRRDSSERGFQLDTTVDTGRRTIGFKLTNSSGGTMFRYGATTLQPNTWYNIAGVYDAAAQTLHVYLNGQLDDGQLVGTVTATQQSSSLDVEIGQRPGSPGAYQFNGRIDDVRIADHAITQSQIQTDMATPLVAGGWSYTTAALLDGSHSFTAKATDTAGNTTTTSAVTATVNTGQVDTTPPTETISTTINTDTGATGTITSGGVTKDNTLGLSGTVSDAGGVSSVQIYDGATLLGPATVSSGNWSYTTAALLGGSHSFTAKATDNAGNTTTTSAVTATVDTTPPTETISTTIITDTGATATITSGGVTKDNTLGLSGTVSDANGVSSVQIYDGATLLGAATISSGNWSYTTAALLDGSHSFTAKATDTAGNTTTTSAVTATINTGQVDTTPPTETISTTINTDTGATTTITSGGVTKDNTLGLSGTVSDAGGVSSVQVYDGATLLGAATISSGNWSYTTPARLDGSHSFTAKATDTAGNTTTTSAVTATVDTTPPTETISTTINTDTGATTTITSGGVTKDNTLGLSGTVSDASGVSSVQVYDGATLLGAATISSGNWSYTTAALLDGSHSFTAKATDTAGNTTTTSAVTATVDTTPPTETISTTINTDTGATATITSGGVTKDNTLGLSGTVSDASGVSSVQVYDGATLLGPAFLTGSYTAGYAFNESSGTPTADATGHGITGTLVNGATFTTAGKYGNAVALNGVNGYVDLGNPTALQLTGSMTVSAWIYATAFPGDDAAVVSRRDSSERGFQLDTTVDTGRRTIGFKLTNSSGGTMFRYGATTLQPNTWYNIAGVYDAAAQTLHVYLNGQLDDGQLVGTVTATQQTSALDVEIGQRPGSPGAYQFNGRIDDVRIADHAITQSQIQTDMATPLVAGGWSYTTAALLDGSHSFTAKATDTAGNTTTTSAVTATINTGQVDTTPPTETISTTINTDTGATATITSGGVTKDNTLGLSGTVSDAGGVSSVQIYDGATLLGPATVSSGNWSYTTAALLGGSHSFTAKATDNAGNTTTTSAVTATVDTTPPTETISTTIITDTGATGTITSGGVTKDNTLGLSGTVSDASGVSSVQVYDGATLLGAATISSGNWSYTTAALLDGSHSFTAKATDTAGNTTTTSAVTATVDTTPPTETISTTINTDTGATTTITSGGVTKDNTLGLSGTVSDASGVSSVQVYDGATLLGAATISSGNWSYTTPARLDGSHSFTAKATDNAGNTTTTSAVTATVDTTPPALSGIVASPATANLNAGKTVTLTANFSEVVAVGSGMPTLNLNDGGTATYVSGSSSSALTFTYTIAAGQNTSDLQVNGFSGATIQDGAGNSANLSGITAANPVNPTGTLKIDTTAPTVISVVASPSKGTITTGKTVNIKLNVSENVTVATGAGSPTLLLNDGGTATYTSGSGTKALTFTYTVPANQGTPDLQVVGIILPSANSIHDLAGNNANLSGAAADLKLKIDTVTTTASDATISGAQTLELFGASAENITFSAGSTGTLRLDAATSFSGTVSGLALGNALDLANVAYTAGMTVGYQPNTSGPAGGLLTVGLANIALLGSYMASMFVASSDGQGGTIVVDPPPTSTTQSAILTGASISDLTLNSSFKGKGAPINVLSVTATNITIGETATSSPQVITVTDPPAGTTGSAATVRDGLHAPSLAFIGGNHEVGGEGGGQANFPDLPQAALANAIDHLPTFLGGNHEVGGEGGGQANFPDLPQAALDNAIDRLPTFLGGNHEVGGEGGGQANFPGLPQAALDNAIDRLPTFLGGNHELFTNYMAAFGGSGSEHGPFETTNSANPPPDQHPLLTYPHA